MSHTKQWLVGALLGVLIAGGMIIVWWIFQGKAVSPTQQVEQKKLPDQATRSVREHFSFAPYTLESSIFTPTVPDVKVELDELKNLKNFEHPLEPQKDHGTQTISYIFSEAQKQSLAGKNFFVAPVHDLQFDVDPNTENSRTDDWTGVYQKIGGSYGEFYRAPENTPFVTTDYVLHVYHRLLEKEFEHAEQTVLYEHVRSLSQKLFDRALVKAATSTGDEKASFERLSGYFLVPLALTESVQAEAAQYSSADTKVDTLEAALAIVKKQREQMSGTIADQAEQELRLIFAATDSSASSPLLGKYELAANPNYFEDYTQYTPRSHYAKNSLLRSYFRSMMWFGRQNLLAASPELTRDSLAITSFMQDAQLKKEWEAIYIPTTFFVGESDDLGIYEYGDLLKQLGDKATWTDEDIKQAQSLAKSYRAPAVLSSVLVGDSVVSSTKEDLLESTRGFRFMGQRFTPDAFILNQLTKGQEQGMKLPSMPTALMVMSAFGDKTSDVLLEDWITQNVPDDRADIHTKLDELKGKFAQMTEAMWTQNIYWGWTRTLKTLFQGGNKLVGYPHFMKEDAWRIKDTNAALGSWTELKHDTLLYAKQSYAERGGGGDDPTTKPAVPKGYVEPNMEFWDRLLALSQMTYEGMNDLGLLDQTFQGRNEAFLFSLRFFRDVATQEIENKVISEATFEQLRMEPGRLNSVLEVLPGDVGIEDNARSALIVDVHTDTVSQQILYEANSTPNSLFVAVKDANGSRLTRGLVYHYYEFTGPLGKRLTDGNWRSAIYEKKDLAPDGGDTIAFPPSPVWTERLK